MSTLTKSENQAFLNGISKIPVHFIIDKIKEDQLSLDECIEHEFDVNHMPVDFFVDKINSSELSFDECIDYGIDDSKISEIKKILVEIGTTIKTGKKASEIYAKINKDKVILDDIRNYLINKDIDEKGLLENTNVDESLLQKIKAFNKRTFPSENNKESLSKGTDVFFLGKSSSGKSCVLASLFKYGDDKGLLFDNINISQNGVNYKDGIVNELSIGIPPDRTDADKDSVTFISTELRKDGEIKPLNFVEMSGEFFEMAAKNHKRIDGSLDANGYLSNSNKKLLFLIVDYKMYQDGENSSEQTQRQSFNSVINVLEQYEKCLQNTYCIYVIVNKSDLFPENTEDKNEFAADFFRDKFTSLYKILKFKQDKYDFELKIMHFSVGNFILNNSFIEKLNTECPRNILDSIHYQSSGKKEEGFFNRIFSSKDEM